MNTLRYPTGEDVRKGDRVRYLGEMGFVEFVVAENASDWFAEQFAGGGAMINAKVFGRIFLSPTDFDDHLHFVGRGMP